ncbi:MAG TPA: hypothetical protein VK993_14610 [Chthoniobacterales bacterium]|nr:hypothetical protein [Chthoniobacterales bacterium]
MLVCASCGQDRPELPVPSVEHVYVLGETVSFSTGGDSARFRTSGWSAPEHSGTWTNAASASMVFRIPPPHGSLLITARMYGHVKPPDLPFQPVLVYVNGRSVASWQVADEKVFTAVVPRDLVANGGGLMTLDLYLPRAMSPAQLGDGGDQRRLGIHCRDVTLSVTNAAATDPEAYTLGSVLRFGSDGEVERFLVRGWSNPEPGWRWTEGKAAVIELKVPPTQAPLTIRARMSGVANPPELPFQPTEVFANGKQIARWEVAELADFQATIPAEIAAGGGPLLLEFRIPKAVSPKELGLGDDPRALGLCWHELEIAQ